MKKALGTLLGNQGWSGSFEGHQKLHVKKCDYFTLRERQDFFVNPRFPMYKTFEKLKESPNLIGYWLLESKIS